mmetsp:Transcript_28300/g.91621  ORF Transcript_28300/g.91621 Transcript_28300/m.91621 type:complete len:224 (-) Transcript_28300:422-1093(-)
MRESNCVVDLAIHQVHFRAIRRPIQLLHFVHHQHHPATSTAALVEPPIHVAEAFGVGLGRPAHAQPAPRVRAPHPSKPERRMRMLRPQMRADRLGYQQADRHWPPRRRLIERKHWRLREGSCWVHRLHERWPRDVHGEYLPLLARFRHGTQVSPHHHRPQQRRLTRADPSAHKQSKVASSPAVRRPPASEAHAFGQFLPPPGTPRDHQLEDLSVQQLKRSSHI